MDKEMEQPLTDLEHEVLCNVLTELDEQFDKADEAQSEYTGHDKNFVYLDVNYGDGRGENMKLHRELLTSKKSYVQIASQVW